MTKRTVDQYIPMSEAMFHVLVALAEGASHGYNIMKDVRERTNGAVSLSTGTLYGIVKRLLADGLIVEMRRRPSADEGERKRRLYTLTPFGRDVARAEAERLHRMVTAARAASLIRGGA